MAEVSEETSGVWAGRALSAAVVLVLIADAAIGLLRPEMLAADMVKTGFTAGLLPGISLVAMVCAVVYAIPRTALIGAILITGFVGGAICTHFRLGEVSSPAQLFCTALALAAWGGVYLREPRLRALLPLRRT